MSVLLVLFIMYVQQNGMYTAFDMIESLTASLLAMFANIALS